MLNTLTFLAEPNQTAEQTRYRLRLIGDHPSDYVKIGFGRVTPRRRTLYTLWTGPN